jgi:hypothetical protein
LAVHSRFGFRLLLEHTDELAFHEAIGDSTADDARALFPFI